MPFRQIMSYAFSISRNIASVLSLFVKALLMDDSRLRMWSMVLLFFRKPLCWLERRLLVSRYHISLELTIRSINLQKVEVRAIGLYDKGFEGSLPGFSMGDRIASFHCLGQVDVSHEGIHEFSGELLYDFITDVIFSRGCAFG